jgi:WD40 repeat protein
MLSRISALLLVSCIPIAAPAQTARQERTMTLPAGVSVEEATISHGGNLVAAVCSDHAVRVWSVGSGELLRSLNEAKEPSAVQFSNDERSLAVAYEIAAYEKGAIKIFGLDSWKVQNDLAAPFSMHTLAFSPDNRRLAFSDLYTQIWDLTNGKKLTDISPPFGGSSSLSFSRDSKWLATADGDGFIRVFDASTGSLRSTVQGFLLEPMAVAFFPDGKTLLTGGVDKTISIVEAHTGKVLHALPKQPGLVWSLDLSADGKQAAAVYRSAERFLDINHIRLWDLDKEIVLADFQKPGLTIQRGTFVGDHYFFIASSANNLTLWSIR